MLRIYADFNSTDEQGRVNLNTVGSLRDVANYRDELREGMTVLLYMTGEFEVEARLVFELIWKGVPNWSTLEYTKE